MAWLASLTSYLPRLIHERITSNQPFFCQVSTIKFLTFSRSSKSLIEVQEEGKEKKKKRRVEWSPNKSEVKWERIFYDLVFENHLQTHKWFPILKLEIGTRDMKKP
jgi:hypothetical protein